MRLRPMRSWLRWAAWRSSSVPFPNRRRGAAEFVVVPMLQSAKLALYQAMLEQGFNKVTLAAKLGKQEGEVRRMLDLDHDTKIGTIENALWLLWKQMATETRPAA